MTGIEHAMPSATQEDGPSAKRQKLGAEKQRQYAPRKCKVFAPFRTVGLVSPTGVPFSAVPLGKTSFQITTSVGRSLQTYDLKRGLNLVFITRPQTPGPITANTAWTDRVIAAWTTSTTRGVWVYKRGKKLAGFEIPKDMDEDVVQIIPFGSWIVGCCSTKIEVWSASTLEHYTTLVQPYSATGLEANVLTGGICIMPTYTNKIFAGRQDGSVEIWNVSTGKLVYSILPPRSDAGAVTALQPSPALSVLAIAYLHGEVILKDIQYDQEVMRLNAGTGDQLPITTISFRGDGMGAGDDGRDAGVMATASFNSGDVTFWDLNDGGKRMGILRGAHGAPTPTREGSDGGISKVEFLPGQAILVTSGLDNALRSWIFDESPFSPIPRILHSRSGHAAPVTTLSFLPPNSDGTDADGKWLLSTSKDKSFWGWSLRRDGQSTEISQGAIRKKAKTLGALSSGVSMEGLKAPEITCLACSLNRDGGMGAMPGVKTLWATSKQLKGKPTETEQNLTGWESVVTGHAGDKFARTWFWGRKRAGRWLLETGDGSVVSVSKTIAEHRSRTLIRHQSVAISPCGTFALVGSASGGIDMFNLQSGAHRQRFPAKFTPTQAKRLKLQGNGANGEAEEKKWARGLGRHTTAVTGLCVDSLNRTVISCGAEGKVKVSKPPSPAVKTSVDGIQFWEFSTGKLLHELDWHATASVIRMVYHRASDLIALYCSDSSIRVVDIDTRRIVRGLQVSKGTINDLCFSNDGRWIIAASSDSIIRIWDLPTGHLIDAMRLSSPCTALAFSNTGEYLATAQDDSIGISLWTNRTLFTHVPTKHIPETDIADMQAPSASGEGGQNIIAAALDNVDGSVDPAAEDEDMDGILPQLEQLNTSITTLSLIPKSRWQTLINLDLIRARNKPTEAPKAPERAPFFLPSLLQNNNKADSAALVLQAEEDTALERSRIAKMDRGASESRFTVLLRESASAAQTMHSDAQPYSPFLDHLKTLPPAAADVEIRSLRPEEPNAELTAFVDALTERLRAKRDYELVQAWMSVFLKCHGEVVAEGTNEGQLVGAVRQWRREQSIEAERLGTLVGYCAGVVGFLRSVR